MTYPQLLHTIFSFLPFMVCLFWTLCFAIQRRRGDIPKRYYTAYIATCTVLYLCHGLFFTVGLPHSLECLWTCCSLSVYPLFYAYLCRLTSSHYTPRHLWPWLVPGALVAVAKYVWPEAGIDRVRLLLFAVQIVSVCYYGIQMLKAFDRELQAVYADTEGRDTSAVKHLLVAVIVVSVLAGAANSVGKQFFGESLWLLAGVSLSFSVMLFALSHICFCRDFTIDHLHADEGEADAPAEAVPGDEDMALIGIHIERLMVEEHYFLRRDLKIGDLVKAVGSNRTYVSHYINTRHHCSFSDYMNRLRTEYAQQLLVAAPAGTKLTQIAEESGFASEQSFYRNFKKFVGLTPAEWVSRQQGRCD